MTIDFSKNSTKIFGLIGTFATVAAMFYSNSFVTIGGLTAFNFFSMIALMCNNAGTFISRPNGVTSEQAGAVPNPDEVKAQIAELQKKLEAK